MKKLLIFLISICFLISACQQKPQESTLKVGVMQNQQLEIVDYIKKLAAKENLIIEIIEFEDYTKINTALKQKDIDVNCFQNEFYLEQVNKERKLDFVSIGKTYLAPLGLYSIKYPTIDELPPNATVAIPDDVITLSRSLLLLDKSGLIKLKQNDRKLYELSDILENKANLQLELVDSSKIREQLEISDFVILTFNYKEDVNKNREIELSPLLQEGIYSNFVQLIVTRKELEKEAKIIHFVKLYNSEQVKIFIRKTYNNKLIPAW